MISIELTITLIIGLLGLIPIYYGIIRKYTSGEKNDFTLEKFSETRKSPPEIKRYIRIIHPTKRIEKCKITFNDIPLPWWDLEEPYYVRIIVKMGGGNVRVPKDFIGNGKIKVLDGKKTLRKARYNDLPEERQKSPMIAQSD